MAKYSIEKGNGIFSMRTTVIDRNAFKLCSVVIPASVKRVETGVFDGCPELGSIEVSELNRVYDSRDNCNAIIETETNKLIAGCEKTIIPDSVVMIGKEAFARLTGLTSIVIPDSVIKIGEDAFARCSMLTCVNIQNPELNVCFEDVFSDCDKLIQDSVVYRN